MENGAPKKLKPVKGYGAFCYFPTITGTHLNFIVHAPFSLDASRDNINSESRNTELIQKLAELAAKSLQLLRDKNLIDDNILKIIPIKKENFATNSISFEPFYDEIKNAMQTEKLIPTKGGCVKADDAYRAEVIKLTEVFLNEQLGALVVNLNAAWAFPRIKRANNNTTEADYIEEIVSEHLGEDKILKAIEINADFIENQSIDWLNKKFYTWLHGGSRLTKIDIKSSEIFLDTNGKATSAEYLFFPSNKFNGYKTVHPDLFNNADTKAFLESLDVREPNCY